MSEAIAGLGRGLGEGAGLSLAGWQVVSVVGDDRLTVPQIARRLGRTRQTVQTAVNDLESRKLVELHANPEHQSSKHVELTDAGSQAFWATLEQQTRWVNAAATNFDIDDLATAANVLRRLHELLDAGVRRGP